MKTIRISLDGCDDSTTFEIEVNESELAFLRMLEKKSHETSTYGCMPVLRVVEEHGINKSQGGE